MIAARAPAQKINWSRVANRTDNANFDLHIKFGRRIFNDLNEGSESSDPLGWPVRHWEITASLQATRSVQAAGI